MTSVWTRVLFAGMIRIAPHAIGYPPWGDLACVCVCAHVCVGARVCVRLIWCVVFLSSRDSGETECCVLPCTAQV